MIIMTPLGGHGTTFILKRNPGCLVRPDTAFGVDYDCTASPFKGSTRPYQTVLHQWKYRTHQEVDNSIRIEENLLRIIEHDKNVFLCGACSSRRPFLTRNKLRALCIVRHPLHAYISFTRNQHPNHVKRFGGFNTEEAVSWWATLWNNIIDDMLASGSNIYQYESLPLSVLKTLKVVGKWDGSHRNDGLRGYLVTKLKLMVEDRFYKIYNSWEIQDDNTRMRS